MHEFLTYLFVGAIFFAGGYFTGRPASVAAAEARLQKLRDRLKAKVGIR